MKLLVIAPQPFFTPRGTPYSVYYRSEVMGGLGVEMDLLTYGQGADVDLENVHLVRIPAFRFLGAVKTGPSLLKLFLDAFIGLWVFGLLLRHRYEIVHAHEEGVFIARFLKPLFRFKLIYDMHSSLPEQLTNFSFTRSRVLIGLFEWLERSALRAADAVVVVCPELLERVSAARGNLDKTILIENSLFGKVRLAEEARDNDRFVNIEEAKALVADGYPLVVYAGTLESYQGIDLLLEAFRLLAERHEAARLLIVGGEPKQVGTYREMAKRLGISDRCLFSGMVPQEVAVDCNRMATMVVSSRLTGTNTPMKIYAQMASGAPIVATRVITHTQVLTDDVAWLVEPTAEDLSDGMARVLERPEEAAEKARNAERIFQERYSHSAYVEKCRRLLQFLDLPE